MPNYGSRYTMRLEIPNSLNKEKNKTKHRPKRTKTNITIKLQKRNVYQKLRQTKRQEQTKTNMKKKKRKGNETQRKFTRSQTFQYFRPPSIPDRCNAIIKMYKEILYNLLHFS